MEAVRAMLSDAHLNKGFWADALTTAVYLQNRSPARTLNGKTPFERPKGKKHNIEHVKTFGWW